MTMGTADDEAIGCGVSAWGLAKVATWSMSPLEVVTSRVVEGIRTSSTSPLEVSSVCKKMVSRSEQQSIRTKLGGVGEPLHLKLLGLRKGFADPSEPSWCIDSWCVSFLALF
jgi:hypothetical protein